MQDAITVEICDLHSMEEQVLKFIIRSNTKKNHILSYIAPSPQFISSNNGHVFWQDKIILIKTL